VFGWFQKVETPPNVEKIASLKGLEAGILLRYLFVN
jgi:hypothetical protein